jgi:hypothetical protein
MKARAIAWHVPFIVILDVVIRHCANPLVEVDFDFA